MAGADLRQKRFGLGCAIFAGDVPIKQHALDRGIGDDQRVGVLRRGRLDDVDVALDKVFREGTGGAPRRA